MTLSKELAALDKIKNRHTSVHLDINFKSNCKKFGLVGKILHTRHGKFRVIEHDLIDYGCFGYSLDDIRTGRYLV